MPATREQHGFAEAGGLLYVAAGINGITCQDDLYAYNPATDMWDDTLALVPSVRQSAVLRAVSGKLYYIGGMESASITDVTGRCDEYDPDTDNWTAKTAKPTPVEDFGSAVYDGKIYCFGGLKNVAGTPTPTNVMEVYDPDANTWDETLDDMPGALWSGDFGTYYDGKIYACGAAAVYTGYPASLTPVSTVYVYDIATDTWAAGTAGPEGFCYREMVVVDGVLYSVAGSTIGSNTEITDLVWRYDVAGDEWLYTGRAPNAVRGSALCLYDGEIYTVGGYDGSSQIAELWKVEPL